MSYKIRLMMALLLLLLCGGLLATTSSALDCSLPVSPATYTAFPTPYNNVLVLHPGLPDCTLFRNTYFQCGYSRVLGDGETIPSVPNLSNSAYVRYFLAWNKGLTVAYVDFDLTQVTTDVTALQLSFLNSPINRISLPNIQLSTVVQYGGSLETDTLTPITSWLLHNQHLSPLDNQVRTVSIQPLSAATLSASHLRIEIQFTEFHDFDWFFLSEVTFCTDPLPLFEPNITFDSSSTTIIQPSAEDLSSGSIELVCTVSSQGSYTWQWERDSSTGIDGVITIGDGSRTTRLTISNLNFNNAGLYSCIAMTTNTMGTQVSNTLVQEIQFPEVVTSPAIISGQDVVMLVCHLHGYQTSPSPPVWFNTSGGQLIQSLKHTLDVSQGNREIVLENGTILPSLMVTLTIHNLSTADEGNYTCRGLREQSVTQLTVLPPPTTQPPTTQPPTTQPPSTQPPTTESTSTIASSPGDNTMAVTTVTTPPPSTTTTMVSTVPVIAAVGVVGGLALLCVLMASPALIVYGVQKMKYSREKRVFLQNHQMSHDSPKALHRHPHDPLPPDKVVAMENPVYKHKTDHASYEQSEVFSYYRDL